jgi:nucleotide-binding universal stress UspA family protein
MSRPQPFSGSILIPTDFSRVCENAIQHGNELGYRLNYAVNFLHVAGPGVEKKSLLLNPDALNFKELFLKKGVVRTRLLIRQGNLFREINRAAIHLKPNLLILGTHGKKGIQHLYGSYALRVALDAPCAVIVVQNRPFRSGYRNILVPVHGELDPEQTSVWLNVMHRLFRSEIVFFRMQERDEDQNKRLKEIGAAISGKLTASDIPCKESIADPHEDFSTQVLNLAGKLGSDLILTIPGSGDHRFSLSAWNERLMFNDLEIPVMILNPPEYPLPEWITQMEQTVSALPYRPDASSSESVSQ